jgi:hypothetical protein
MTGRCTSTADGTTGTSSRLVRQDSPSFKNQEPHERLTDVWRTSNDGLQLPMPPDLYRPPNLHVCHSHVYELQDHGQLGRLDDHGPLYVRYTSLPSSQDNPLHPLHDHVRRQITVSRMNTRSCTFA